MKKVLLQKLKKMKKKKTNIWSLWFMLMVYFCSIIGIVNFYADYIISDEIEGFLQFIATILTVCLVVFFCSQFIKTSINILKRFKL